MTQKNIELLAPAGDKECFFAAMDAGADAIYIGLRDFSARAAAKNFSLDEAASLVSFAHSKNKKVYIAFNSLVIQRELSSVFAYLKDIAQIGPDALIIQDLGIVNLLRKMDLNIDLHLSTLANFSISTASDLLSNLGIKRVVLPRELTIDEIKWLSQKRNNIGLEVFVHGALCYGVSGRCYWSSMLGGKSGLKGMCVQPCRRTYQLGNKKGKFFSCNDLSLDVLIKVLMQVDGIESFKIEGRKKSPHYVYYTTKAYQILKDNVGDRNALKMALELLALNLGRRSTHYYFLSHRKYCPIEPDKESASGLLIGHISTNKRQKYFRSRIDLYGGDRIRIAYEGESAHDIIKINRYVKKGKKVVLRKGKIKVGTPVFLIDRKEQKLLERINEIKQQWMEHRKKLKVLYHKNNMYKLENSYLKYNKKGNNASSFRVCISMHLKQSKKQKGLQHGFMITEPQGPLWSKIKDKNTWLWIDPVIWPEDEKNWIHLIETLQKKGYKNYIVNSIQHVSLFDVYKNNIWLGPFANIANSETVEIGANLGVKGAVVSPELKKEDYLELVKNSPIPLGILVYGLWPYTISRTKHPLVPLNTPIISPKKECFFVSEIGKNYYVYPNWLVDLRNEIPLLKKAGFVMFLEIDIPFPKGVKKEKKPYKFNFYN